MNSSPIKTIACGLAGAYWNKAMELLVNDNIIDIIYCTSTTEHFQEIKSFTPDTLMHDVIDAIKGVPLNIPDVKLVSIDQPYLTKMYDCQVIALEMMNRMDPEDIFSLNDRLTLYYDMVQYWKSIILYYKPNLILFPEAPHAIYDYILYKLAQLHNIETRMFGYFEINESYFFITSSYENDTPVYIEYKKNVNKTTNSILSELTKEYINKIRGNYFEAVPFYDRHLHIKNKSIKYGWIPTGLLVYLKKLYRVYESSRYIFRGPPINYLKHPISSISQSKYSGYEYFKYQIRANKIKRKLSNYYYAISSEPDFSKPYIFIALHYQPEMSSSPIGNVYTSQYLIIDLISKHIPKDWMLYIKEHPWQFSHTSKGERSSSRNLLYEKILQLDNTRLISLQYKSFDLIDKAKATTSISGKVGIESVIRGIPVLLFGDASYKGCEGIFSIKSKKDLVSCINQIEAGYTVDNNKLEFYLSCIEKVCRKGYIDPDFQKITSVSSLENAMQIAEAIKMSV